MEIKIDEELRALIPPLSKEEYKQLEENIKQWGCLDPLKIWPVPESNKIVLLDGHNRFAICSEHKLHYFTESVPLTDRAAAINWMIANQLGRRNLSAAQASYLRGRQQQQEKQSVANPDGVGGKSRKIVKPQNEVQQSMTTSNKLAKQHGVSKATIERDADYAKAVDAIVAATALELQQQLLSADSKLTKSATLKLAELAQEEPEVIMEIIEQVQQAPNKTAASAVVKKATVKVNGFSEDKKMLRILDFKDATDAINWLRERFTVTELAESFAKQISDREAESESVKFLDGEDKSSMVGHAIIFDDGRSDCYN